MSGRDEQEEKEPDEKPEEIPERPSEILSMDLLMKSLFGPSQPILPPVPQEPKPQASSFKPDEPVEKLELKQPGELFGPYEIHSLLGIGGFGVVYRAIDTFNGTAVALKLPRSDRMHSSSAIRLFQKEARFQEQLAHPSIVRLIATGTIENTFYIATEFQHGQDLSAWMEAHRTEITQELVVAWGMALADALQHAFDNGVVHRDLKPRNIIVVQTGPGATYTPRITDFGLAFSTLESASGSSASGKLVGTVGYMAPEQVMSGNSRSGIRADIYSLGIILAELALGRPLDKHENIIDYIVNYNQDDRTVSLRPLRHLVSADLYSLLHKCVDVDPERRYQRPRDLWTDLQRLQAGVPLGLRRNSSRENLRRIVKKNPVLSMSTLLCVLFLGIIAVTQFINQRSLGRKNEELKNANETVSKQNDDLKAANARVLESQASTKRAAFTSDVRLGFSELREGRMESVHEQLDKARRIGRDLKPGLIDFAWRYLDYRSSREYRSFMIDDFGFYLTGPNWARIQSLFQTYRNFGTRHYFEMGVLSIDSTQIISRSVHTLSRMGEHFRATYKGADDQWYFQQDENVQKINNEMPYDEVLFNEAADRFYYFDANDGPGHEKNDRPRIERQTGRMSYYFSGFRLPAISARGDIIAGYCRKKPGVEQYTGVIYDAKSDEWIETGIEIAGPSWINNHNYKPELSLTGKLVAFRTGPNDDIFIFDLMTRKTSVFPWRGQKPQDDGARLSLDEERALIAVGDVEGQVEIWRIGEKAPAARFKKMIPRLFHPGFLPDGRVFMQVAFTKRLWIWDPFEARQNEMEMDHGDEVWSLEFDRSGKYLVSTGDNAKVKLWDVETGQGRTIGEADSLVTRGRFSANQKQFAACDYSGHVLVWETADWSLKKRVRVTNQKLRSLAWGPNGDFLVCVGNGKEIIELNLANDSVRLYPVEFPCFDLVYAPARGDFVVGIQDGPQKILFMKFPGGKVEAALALERMPTRFALDPVENRLVTGFAEGGIGLVSLNDRTLEREIGVSQADGEIVDLIFTRDGRNIIAALTDGRALIYETANWEKIGEINENKAKIHAFATSPDGKKMASGDMSGKIRILQLPPATEDQ